MVIVNTARGGLIDEDAVDRYLIQGHIGYACLDVFAEEPYFGPLKDLESVILSPHVGSYAREARIQMEERAVLNLLSGLEECGVL
jgi:D-3-phosphoglycerate dehydrogenase